MKVYTIKKKEKTEKNKGLKILGITLFWIALWQIVSMAVGNSILLPSPWDTVHALGGLVQTTGFYLDCGSTILRCVVAMVLSFGAGVALGLLAYRHEAVRSLLKLPVSFFKAVPVMAIVIYMIILASSNWVAILVCFLMCFPVVYTNVLSGLDSMDGSLLEVAQVYRLSQGQTTRYLLLPGILPEIKSAVSLIAGLSWKAVVAAEVLSIPLHSLGYEMMNAKYYLDTAALFAYITVIIFLSLGFEKIIKVAMGKIGQREYEGSKLGYGKGRETGEMEQGPKVELAGVSKAFGGKEALRMVGFEAEAGQVTGLKGPSGAGKTTIARILAGLEKEDEGQVALPRGTRVSYLFQEERLMPWLNVYDNMALSVIGAGQGLGQSEAQIKERVVKMAEDLEIGDVLWKLPSQLSGGMRHRVAIGRALLAPSNLMIMDEPFRGLDMELKNRIIDRLWERELAGKTVILISHSEEDQSRLPDKVIYM